MPTKWPDSADVDSVMRYIQSQPNLSRALNMHLVALEGYEALPRELRNRIEDAAVAIWGAGYLHAMTRRE